MNTERERAGEDDASPLPTYLTIRPLMPGCEPSSDPSSEVVAAMRRFRNELIAWLGSRDDIITCTSINGAETRTGIRHIDEADETGLWLKVTIEPR